MKVTTNQLRTIIKEAILKEALPPHLQKHFRKDGSSVHVPQIKDVTPAGYGPGDVNPSTPTDVYDRILDIDRGDRQDHLFDLVDALEGGDADVTLDVLLKSLEDAEHEQGEQDDELEYAASRPWRHN